MLTKLIWALFGNDEDGPYGAGTNFNPEGKKAWCIAVRWWFRNPFHNLTHHVIGIYGEDFRTYSIYENFPGWSKMTRVLRGKTYPYWNYQAPTWQFYIGWRSSGAFGIALRRRKYD